MSAGQGEDAERFAAAVEQGAPPGSSADLARELEIVAMLRARGAAFAPDAEASARMKARVLAALAEPEAPGAAPAETTLRMPPVGSTEETTLIATVTAAPAGDAPTAGDPDVDPTGDDVPAAAPVPGAARPGRRGRHVMPSRPAARARRGHRPAPAARRRVLTVAATALAAVVALTVGGLAASRDALPGDGVLYAMKRVSEDVGLALTFDEEAKAQRHLELAATRLAEIEQLMARDTAGSSDPLAVESAIRDFEAATSAGSRLLLDGEDVGGVGAPAVLERLRTWAEEQSVRLEALRTGLPVPAQPEAENSLSLLERLLGRTEALQGRSACTDVTSGAVDDLGPVPAEGPCIPGTSADPGQATGPADRVTPTAPPAPRGAEPTPGAEPEQPDLLPKLGPDGAPLAGPGAGATDAPAPSAGSGGDAPPASRQLLPPITLRPLLPGLPEIEIGGGVG